MASVKKLLVRKEGIPFPLVYGLCTIFSFPQAKTGFRSLPNRLAFRSPEVAGAFLRAVSTLLIAMTTGLLV